MELLRRLCAQLAFVSRSNGVLLLDEEGAELARAGRCDASRSRTHISLVAGRAILVILHDDRTSPALVHLRVREARPRFERAIAAASRALDGDRAI